MDEASKKLIDSMLKEDAFSAENPWFSALQNGISPADVMPAEIIKEMIDEEIDVTDSDVDELSKVSSIKSTPKINASKNQVKEKSATFNQRWTAEEDALLIDGIANYGFGHWALISDKIPQRNTVQCKNRGRSLKLTGKLPKALMPQQLVIEAAKVLISSEDLKPVHTAADEKVADIEFEDLDVTDYDESETRPMFTESNANVTSKASIKGRILPRDQVTHAELKGLPEWFHLLTCTPKELAEIHPRVLLTKTPSRYLRIRNHLIDEWISVKPHRLTKSRARVGIKEGDVNALGRVFLFLQENGFINHDTVTSKGKYVAKVSRSPTRRYEKRVIPCDDDGVPVKKLKSGRASRPEMEQARQLMLNAQYFSHDEVEKSLSHLPAEVRKKFMSTLDVRKVFGDFLHNHGYRVVDEGKADGSCLFEALVDQTLSNFKRWDRVPTVDRSAYLSFAATSMRSILVDEIRSYYKDYALDIFGMSANSGDARVPDFEEVDGMPKFVQNYLERLAKEKELGDAVCIAAYAARFQVAVRVYFENDKGSLDHFEFEPPKTKSEVSSTSVIDPLFAVTNERMTGVISIAWKPSQNRNDVTNHYVSIYPTKSN